MTFKIEIKESANQDVVSAFLYYESKLEGLGERFLNRWEQALDELKREPFIYQKKYKEFRQVSIRPYPYHIIFEVEQNTIVVYKVPYAGRHPSKRYKKK